MEWSRSCGPSLWQCQWCRPRRCLRPKVSCLDATSGPPWLKRWKGMKRSSESWWNIVLSLETCPWPNSHCSSSLWTCHWPERHASCEKSRPRWHCAPDRARAKPLQHRCPWRNCDQGTPRRWSRHQGPKAPRHTQDIVVTNCDAADYERDVQSLRQKDA